MKRATQRVFWMGLASIAAWGQSSFEVASVKPQAFQGQGRIGVFVSGNRLHAEHAALVDLIQFAYDVRPFQVTGGPSWVRSNLQAAERYEVDARALGDATLTAKDFRPMLQTLLAERFQLKVQRGVKEFPAFRLVVAKGGLKMKPAAEGAKYSSRGGRGTLGAQGIHLAATGATLANVVNLLDAYAGRPVVDQTGLTGCYDFEMEWARETSGEAAAADAAAGPSLFTAVQETLGLRLEAGNAPFETLVIESAAKPSEN